MNALPPWHDSPIMKALRLEPVSRPPIWLMRQAGRYMAEYRAVREKTGFIGLCKNPKLAAEVMQTAVETIGVDAAIIFSDLLLILEPMGFGLEFAAGDGPVIHCPFREADDLNRIVELEDLSALDYVFETVTETRRLISPEKPLIGFAGAPFTLAGYAIEGGSSRNFEKTKQLMYCQPEIWHELAERLARSAARYLNAQIAAGAQIVQIFDSWIGALGVDDYRRFVLPHSRTLIQSITSGTPVIHFGTGNPELLPLFAEAGGNAIGVDWRISMSEAAQRIGPKYAVQGNLDPCILLTNKATIQKEATRLCEQMKNRPGFLFNLGHGILKETPVENVITLVRIVQQFANF